MRPGRTVSLGGDCIAYDRRIKAKQEKILRSFGEIFNTFHQRERQRDTEITFGKISPVTVEDVKSAANAAAEDVKKTIDKARDQILKDTDELKEICDPVHEARRANSRRKRKNRPDDVTQTYPKFQTFNSIVSRRLTTKSQS